MPALATTSTLSLRLFGPLQARVGDEHPPRLRSHKGEWLLALLALRGESGTKRDWLAGTLWPDSEENLGLYYLRRELSGLRQALGEESSRLVAGPGANLRLDLTGACCDVREFDSAIASADPSSLEAAVSLYRGPLLEGCSEEWVILERSSREQACLSALERLAESASSRGDSSAAVSHLQSLVAIDPLRESAQRALMKALSHTGASAAVVQVYRDLRLHLHRELNTAPDPETTSLYHRIRDQARRRRQPTSRAIRPVDTAHVTRVPVPVTRLIGRNEELWEVRQRLGSTRLLTLTGAGGVGKTRLAIEIAREMNDECAGGACFVELAALSSAALVPQAVMDAFDLRPQPRRTAVEALVDRLRSSDLLLVLDKCEHVIQPCAELAGSLLGACPLLRILTTSREALGIAGESVWRVPSLSVPPAAGTFGKRDKTLIAEAMEYAAVRLFVQRAQQARSDLTLTTHNVEAVSEVCRRLDGIPLAIELAAARARSLTVEDIRSRLDERFRLLTGGSRAALPRHQTLRSLIDWSYDLLNEPERALFGRLSVFAGGWTLEAAEAVCAGKPVEAWEVLDLLTALADKSLVVAETAGAHVRYRLPETVRQYGRDRLLEAGDGTGWRDRHRDWFLALAEAAEPKLQGSGQGTWLARLEDEHDDLRVALEWSAEEPAGGEAGLRLCGALGRFWSARGYLREGRTRCAAALAHPGAAVRTLARARTLNGAGVLALFQGDLPGARSLLEQALALNREMGDRMAEAGNLNNLGNLAGDLGEHEASRLLLEKALALNRELGNRAWEAGNLNGLGNVAQRQDNNLAARSLFQQALALNRELGNRAWEAINLDNLGNVARKQRDYEAARSLLEQALALNRELGNRAGEASNLSNLGIVAQERQDYATARPLFEQALALTRELGSQAWEASNLSNLGLVVQAHGDYETARSYYEQALALSRDLGNRRGVAASLASLGNVARAQGDDDAAQALLREALAILRELEDRASITASLEELASLAGERQPARAARLWSAATRLREEIGSPLSPVERPQHEQDMAAARATLGDAAFQRVWAAGQGLNLEQAIECALGDSDS